MNTYDRIDELYAIINSDGSLTTHQQHVDICRDGMDALAKLDGIAGERDELDRLLAVSRVTATRCQEQSTLDMQAKRDAVNALGWYRETILLVVESESDAWRNAGTGADKRAGGVEACEMMISRIAALELRPACSPYRAQVKKLRGALEAAIAELEHEPIDCYSTGPLTGKRVDDLVICPGCAAVAGGRDALEATKEDE